MGTYYCFIKGTSEPITGRAGLNEQSFDLSGPFLIVSTPWREALDETLASDEAEGKKGGQLESQTRLVSASLGEQV